MALTEEERQVLLAIQDGLPLVPEPYREVGTRLGMSEERVMELVRSMLAEGKIKRLGAVPNHYALGIRANGMAVWDVPDDRVSQAGRKVGSFPEVSHCYLRPRQPPDWPYNLFAMVHGQSRQEVLATVGRIAQEADIVDRPHEVLFSTRQFRRRGTRLRKGSPGEASRRGDQGPE
jgi:DNA-binding Lrp family transcriptional regulator